MTMYYLMQDDKIVLYNKSKKALKETIALMPEFADLEIKSTNLDIVDFEFRQPIATLDLAKQDKPVKTVALQQNRALPLDKPVNNGIKMPMSFGGIKNNWSDSLIQSGYQHDRPAILGGDNLNFLLDNVGRDLVFGNEVCDYIVSLKEGETPIVDVDNKLNATKIGARLYSATEKYMKSDVVIKADDDGIHLYKSLVDNNVGNAVTSKSHWKENLASIGSIGLVKPDGITTEVDEEGVLSVNTDFVNQSKALETGNVSSVPEIYADIKNYAHSTFCGYQASNASPLDPKKFIKYGSPTITDDGIASGFSGSSCIRCVNITELVYQANNWEIDTKFTTNTIGTVQAIIGDASEGGVWKPQLQIQGNGKLKLNLSTESHGWQIQLYSATTLLANTTYYTKIIFNGSKYQLFISTDNVNFVLDAEVINSTKIKNTDHLSNLGADTFSNGALSVPFLGSIDLKQFSITVDGIPVFSGNKTGLDTIKSNDYTVVGSPTISADGVASGFESGSTVSSNVSVAGSDNFILILPVKVTDSVSTLRGIANLYNTSENDQVVRVRIEGSALRANGFGGAIGNFDSKSNTISANKQYYIKVDRNGNTVTINYYDENFNKITDPAVNETFDITGYTINSIDKLRIGMVNGIAGGNGLVVDLNGVKLYKNGSLIYQPCLKIPYTLSKTGSKIVDARYRDRVQDMYEQFGYAPYYTIDEENKNFTLPMGEIYGMIEGKVNSSNLKEVECVVETYHNDASGYRVWSDGWCEQWGSSDISGTSLEVSLLKPYRDNFFTIIASQADIGSAGYHTITAGNVDNATIQLRCNPSGNPTVDWKACGYIEV